MDIMKRPFLIGIIIVCVLYLIFYFCSAFKAANEPIAFHIDPIAYETVLGGNVLTSDTGRFMILNICGVGTDSSCVSYNLYRDSTQGNFVHGGVMTMANEDIPIFSDSVDVASLNATLTPKLGVNITSQRITPPPVPVP